MSSLILINIFEKIFASLLLIILFPLIILLFVLLLIFQGRPVIFISERVGINGSLFNIFKFRTMENKITYKDPDKITFIGKFLRKLSLDELLQIINIIKGEMSFVGPRPLPLDIENKIEFNKRIKRRLIKPGLTGLSQINYQPNRSLNEKVNLDIKYVNNFSISLYFYILIFTIPIVFKKFFTY